MWRGKELVASFFSFSHWVRRKRRIEQEKERKNKGTKDGCFLLELLSLLPVHSILLFIGWCEKLNPIKAEEAVLSHSSTPRICNLVQIFAGFLLSCPALQFSGFLKKKIVYTVKSGSGSAGCCEKEKKKV